MNYSQVYQTYLKGVYPYTHTHLWHIDRICNECLAGIGQSQEQSPPILICVVAAKNREVTTHARLSQFSSMAYILEIGDGNTPLNLAVVHSD